MHGARAKERTRQHHRSVPQPPAARGSDDEDRPPEDELRSHRCHRRACAGGMAARLFRLTDVAETKALNPALDNDCEPSALAVCSIFSMLSVIGSRRTGN